MSLISLLIALLAERYLVSTTWQFDTFYYRYMAVIEKSKFLADFRQSRILSYAVVLIPAIGCYLLLSQIEHSLLYLIASTLILMVCFGCIKTRDAYKHYLMSGVQDELTTCDLQRKQLQQEKNITDMGFGQTLVWLNYRYFIAVMLFFVLFGAAGALFYRLLTAVNECANKQDTAAENEKNSNTINVDDGSSELDVQSCDNVINEQQPKNTDASNANNVTFVATQGLLFWLDWLPVRVVAFGYMLVGHFSKAMPVWLDNVFAFDEPPSKVLIAVAEKSEDVMVDANDCTLEPSLLVKLAKRNLLLCLVIVSMLILTGVIT